MEDWNQETCIISAVTSGPTEPKLFQEEWNRPLEKKEIIGELPSDTIPTKIGQELMEK